MSSGLTPSQLATAAQHLEAAKMFSLASCVMLFFDITITFGDEVEKIWKQRFTGATVLWFLNRYLSPLAFIIVIVSFHADWPESVCDRYILFPEVLKTFTAFVVGVIFILRLYSIYARSYAVLIFFSLLLVGELGVKIWAFTDGTRLQLPPPLVGCILVGKSAPGKRFVYTWAAELVFDTAVFFATLYRTIALYRTSELGPASSLMRIILRDGIMYFAAIFASNLVSVLIFIAATPDLKAVNASFSTLITSLMVSRLMLNLRREALRRAPIMDYRQSQGGVPSNFGHFSVMSSAWAMTENRTFESTIIGNLGAPISQWDDEDDELRDGMDGMEMSRRVRRKQIAVEVTSEVIVDNGSVHMNRHGPWQEHLTPSRSSSH